jgi:hypothetical protein
LDWRARPTAGTSWASTLRAEEKKKDGSGGGRGRKQS